MKFFFMLVCVLGSFETLLAQALSGQVFDSKTKQPLGYVNVGVPRKGVGTISDENGKFSILLDDKFTTDTIKISIVGYKPLISKVSDARNQTSFYLEEDAYELSEVVIRPVKHKTEIVGNKDLGSPCVNFIGDNSVADATAEVGTLIKIKKRRTFIDNIKFGVCKNDFDSITIRINIYTKENVNILKKPIYVVVKKNDKNVMVDTKKYNIEVSDDFIIAFEAVDILRSKKGGASEKGFSFSGGFFGSDLLTRNNIYVDWKKVPAVVVGFNATITYEVK